MKLMSVHPGSAIQDTNERHDTIMSMLVDSRGKLINRQLLIVIETLLFSDSLLICRSAPYWIVYLLESDMELQ